MHPYFDAFSNKNASFPNFFKNMHLLGCILVHFVLKNASFSMNFQKMHLKNAPSKCTPKVHAPRCVNSTLKMSFCVAYLCRNYPKNSLFMSKIQQFLTNLWYLFLNTYLLLKILITSLIVLIINNFESTKACVFR